MQIRFWVDDEKKGEQARDLLDKELKRLHALLTVYAKSPLTDLNDHSGRWTAIPCEAKGLIKKSQLIAKATKGAFDPTIGPLVKLWKIGGETGEIPDEKAITKAKSLVSYERIETKESAQGCFARLGKNQSIDLGAIAKGFVGTQLARLLQKSGVKHAILDLGGNIVLLGNSPEGNSWRIGVQDPRSTRGTILATIEEKDTSIVTSGNYQRSFTKDDKLYHHIIDLTTGLPADSGLNSVTVICPSSVDADMLSTICFLLGEEKGRELIDSLPDVEAIFLITFSLYIAPVPDPYIPNIKF